MCGLCASPFPFSTLAWLQLRVTGAMAGFKRGPKSRAPVPSPVLRPACLKDGRYP